MFRFAGKKQSWKIGSFKNILCKQNEQVSNRYQTRFAFSTSDILRDNIWYQRFIPTSLYDYLMVTVFGSISSYMIYRWWIVRDDINLQKAIKNENYQEVIQILEKKTSGENTIFPLDVGINLFMCYSKLKEFSKAEKLLLQMIKVIPQEEQASRFQLVHLYIEQNKLVGAIKQLALLIRNNPEVNQVDKQYIVKEIEPRFQKNLDVDQTKFTDESQAEMLGVLGMMYFFLKQYEQAEYLYEESLKKNSNKLNVQLSLGVLWFMQDKIEASQKILESIAYSAKANTRVKEEALYALVDVFASKKQFERSYTICKKDIKGLVKQEQCLLKVANIYRMNDQSLNKQENIIKEVLRINPKSLQSIIFLAKINIERNKYNQALSILEDALVTNGEIPSLLSTIGETYVLMQQHAKAIQFYKKIVDLCPEDLKTYVYLSQIYSHLGDNVNTIKNLEKCVDLNTQDPNVYRQLITLYQNNEDSFSESRCAQLQFKLSKL